MVVVAAAAVVTALPAVVLQIDMYIELDADMVVALSESSRPVAEAIEIPDLMNMDLEPYYLARAPVVRFESVEVATRWWSWGSSTQTTA